MIAELVCSILVFKAGVAVEMERGLFKNEKGSKLVIETKAGFSTEIKRINIEGQELTHIRVLKGKFGASAVFAASADHPFTALFLEEESAQVQCVTEILTDVRSK